MGQGRAAPPAELGQGLVVAGAGPAAERARGRAETARPPEPGTALLTTGKGSWARPGSCIPQPRSMQPPQTPSGLRLPGEQHRKGSASRPPRRWGLSATGASSAPSPPLHALRVEGRGSRDLCKRLIPRSPAPPPRSPSPALRPRGRFRHRGRPGLQRSTCVSGHSRCAGVWTGPPQTCVVGLRPPEITQAACARPHYIA